MPSGTTTINYQFFKPDDNQPGWGSAMRNFIDIVDRDLHASIVFVNTYQPIIDNVASDISALKTLINDHINQVQGAHAATAISETTDGNVQVALDRIRTRLFGIDSAIAALTARMAAAEAALKAVPSTPATPVTTPVNGVVTPSFTSSVNGLDVSFSGSATTTSHNGSTYAGITNYTWDFGDNTTGGGTSPSHTYAKAGTYPVTFRVYDSYGVSGMESHTVIVTPSAFSSSISATLNPYTGDATTDGAYAFSVTSSDKTITSYLWEYGDGSTDSRAAPTHIYQTPGTYTAKLTAKSADGSTSTATTSVIVKAPIGVNMTFSPSTVYLGTPVQFSSIWNNDGTSMVELASYAWDFGDGVTSTLEKPTHIYASPGRYTAKLVGKTSDGRADAVTMDVVVESAPLQLSFSADAGGNYVGNPVTFTATTQLAHLFTPLKWMWDAGDGTALASFTNSSNTHSFTHTFNAPGTYTLRVTVQDNLGSYGFVTTTFTIQGGGMVDNDHSL